VKQQCSSSFKKSPYRGPATEEVPRLVALPVGAALQRDVQDLVLLELSDRRVGVGAPLLVSGAT